MDEQIQELESNNTWVLVLRPHNKPVISGRWVYRAKQKADGSVAKYKARYVARGFLQQEGVNYFDTFAGTLKSTSYRLLLNLAFRAKWAIRQWDVVTAFPQADLDTEIYMEQPLGYTKDQGLVCLLKKALYGLKQAGRQWLLKLADLLGELGFKPISADQQIFAHTSKPILIAAYVDDLLAFAETSDLIRSIFVALSKVVKLKDLGFPSYYLSIELTQDDHGLYLSQTGFIRRLLDKFDKSQLKPRQNPCVKGERLFQNQDLATPLEISSY
jgi:hypothetical protein